MSRFSVAKAKILDELEAILELLYNAQRKHMRKGLWNVVNPYRPGAKAEQMAVWRTGARRGAFKDYGGDVKGDAVDLVAFGLKGTIDDDSRMAAVEWIEDRYGLKSMSPARREQIDQESKARRQAAEARDQRRRETSIGKARRFFYSCSERLIGTPADLYLASRNVEISKIQHLGRSLRFHNDCEYWMLDHRPRFPALVSAMVDVTGRIGACHYTFLKHDGSDKIGAAEGVAPGKAKLMFPETSGLVIRLTNGDSGLSAEEAVANGVAGVCAVLEGVEDGLSVAQAAPQLRIWTAGSLSGLLSVPDHAAVSAWLIFKDNDWGKPQAQKQFNRAIARLKGFGKPLEVVSMPADWGKDVNDAIRSGW